jgi:hypothetical protein
MSTLEILRQAASALLATAPEPVVRRTLRELLAEENYTPADQRPGAGAISPCRQGSGVQQPVLGANYANTAHDSPRLAATGSLHPAALPKATLMSEWPTLRQRVRAAMHARGVSFERLGSLLGYAPATLQQAVGTNRPKTLRMMERIKAWLVDGSDAATEAPEKALPPFRIDSAPAGAGNRGVAA